LQPLQKWRRQDIPNRFVRKPLDGDHVNGRGGEHRCRMFLKRLGGMRRWVESGPPWKHAAA
jgi:hypothetical protein